ncbi:ABC transporter ATP-binding protein [Sesbania bispinosa]|nr:ABC transporter ATP-binding protein [Sesbania bispinosa]
MTDETQENKTYFGKTNIQALKFEEPVKTDLSEATQEVSQEKPQGEPIPPTPPASPQPTSPPEPSPITKLVAQTLTELEKEVSKEPTPVAQHEQDIDTEGQMVKRTEKLIFKSNACRNRA